MARTKSIAFLMILMLFAAGCGIADRARVGIARLMACQLFAIRNGAALTQSTFRKHDVVAPRIDTKKATKPKQQERKPEVITGPIQLASLRLPAATVGVRDDAAVLCNARQRLVRRYVIVTAGAPGVSVGG